MADSEIEWTEKVWNPVRGCSLVSPGCANCYAMGQAHRFSGVGGPYEGLTKRRVSGGVVWTGEVREVSGMLDAPLRWRKSSRVFVNSMSDLFHDGVSDEFIDKVFGVMTACEMLTNVGGHTFQVLTKRAERLAAYFAAPPVDLLKRWSVAVDHIVHLDNPDVFFSEHVYGQCAALWGDSGCAIEPTRPWQRPENLFPLRGVHLGVSVEDRKHGLPRIEHLRRVPAAVRWLSVEPLLEDLGAVDLTGISWVVVGAESGHGARPFFLAWARSIVAQCHRADTPVFVKQLGARPYTTCVACESPSPVSGKCRGHSLTLRDRAGADPAEWPEDLRVQEFPR